MRGYDDRVRPTKRVYVNRFCDPRIQNVGHYHAFSKCLQYVMTCEVRQTITQCDQRVSQFCVLTALVVMGVLSNYVGAADP